MNRWDAAIMAMAGVSAIGFLAAEGETRRVRWIQAMRHCLIRMNSVIRYQKPGLPALLTAIDLRTTQQERELTGLLHACAERLSVCTNPQLLQLFSGECGKLPGYGVLSREDREAFEAVLAELGRTGLEEQLRLIDEADERLRVRERMLEKEAFRRAQLIRALGVTGGAALFLLLI